VRRQEAGNVEGDDVLDAVSILEAGDFVKLEVCQYLIQVCRRLTSTFIQLGSGMVPVTKNSIKSLTAFYRSVKKQSN
jgi:hypothetical protein